MARKPEKKTKVVETTGHEWDGITELDNPMPRWWLWTFYLTIIWGIGYMIAYPAWPMINGATPGLLGYSSRAEVAKDIATVDAANAPLNDKIVSLDLAAIAGDAEVGNYAVSAGGAVFRTFCIQCHGSGAAGSVGYPNLRDDDWLWGGDIETIYTTISHGIRADEDEDTRLSEMPVFGDDYLSKEEIAQAAQFVLSLTGRATDETLLEAGAVVFEDNCSACHGVDGTGDINVGAPNLADAIWLYGSDLASVTDTITNSRAGVMPAWSAVGRLNEAQLRQVTVYVHELGGGE
ncbi:MAG: cytochrome-c oxidase, cbb3-type subunit III [Rhodobacteraceae bacterium]|nr:MAG: cytochrome-c oxidase, cbb3-type subunit III [Paracoccaceae bacterium]